MQLSGIDSTSKSNAMQVAFKNSGYRLREKKVSWPRAKNFRPVQVVDCSRMSCKNVHFLVVR